MELLALERLQEAGGDAGITGDLLDGQAPCFARGPQGIADACHTRT
jgi:hypothetical protein